MSSSSELPAAVAYALHQWNSAEIRLAHLFQVLSDMPDHQKAHDLFDGVINLEIRLSLCSSLIEHENIDALEKEMWNRLKNKIMSLYKKRHESAHFTLISDGSGQVTHLAPFWSEGKFFKEKINYLSLDQVQERTAKFAEIRPAIGWFWVAALKRRGQHETYPMPESPLILRIREAAARNLEERAQRLPPSYS